MPPASPPWSTARRRWPTTHALAAIGARGRYGFYEAVDFTPSRVPEGETSRCVRAYMAHHQGMTHRRDRQCAARRRACANASTPTSIVQATELLLQERTPRDVSVAHPRAEEVGHRRAHRRPAGAGGAPAQQPARLGAADPPAFERPLLRDGHRRGLRLQPLERPRRHALARRRDARRLRQLRPAARRGDRPRVVGGLSALRGPARQLRRELHRGSRRNHPQRRRRHHHARSAASRRKTTPRCAASRSAILGAPARDRSHFVRRARAGAASRRHRAPGVLEDVRAHRIPRRAVGADRATAGAARPTNPNSGPRTMPSSKATTVGTRSSRPTARASSAAAASCAHRSPCSRAARCPAPPARCSTRCSRCATACACRPAAPRASRSGPAWRRSRDACSI